LAEDDKKKFKKHCLVDFDKFVDEDDEEKLADGFDMSRFQNFNGMGGPGGPGGPGGDQEMDISALMKNLSNTRPPAGDMSGVTSMDAEDEADSDDEDLPDLENVD
jgi:hypothetical protein